MNKKRNNIGFFLKKVSLESLWLDLSYEEDFYHCVKQPKIGNCDTEPLIGGGSQYDTYRGMDISGYDPHSQWLYLGSNTGMPNEFDSDEDSGVEWRDPEKAESNNKKYGLRFWLGDSRKINGVLPTREFEQPKYED